MAMKFVEDVEVSVTYMRAIVAMSLVTGNYFVCFTTMYIVNCNGSHLESCLG
jgi:hypothetical protein